MEGFVIVSGLPASGKSTLARRLAPALRLPLFDKDDLLERLYDSRGIGDAAWRRALSRESDRMLQAEALAAGSGVLVSHWHVPGLPPDSGTPTEWLRDLDVPVVHLRCICSPEIAASRFVERRRHPGHLDDARSRGEVLDLLRAMGILEIVPCVEVDSSAPPDLDVLVQDIRGRMGQV